MARSKSVFYSERGKVAVFLIHTPRCLKDESMQDLIWVAIMLGLLALTLAYIRLCDQA